MRRTLLSTIALLFLTSASYSSDPGSAESPCSRIHAEIPNTPEAVMKALLASPETVFPDLLSAIGAKLSVQKPVKQIRTGDKNIPLFPSYSACTKSYFRVATLDRSTDQKIADDGWKSGWIRKQEELKSHGMKPGPGSFDALSPENPIEDRIIQYVRIKSVPSRFPKDSTIVGVLENPIRTLSVGYHTGYDSGMGGNYMRMDEIELGPCARAPECQKITPVDSSAVFAARKLTPRYSTEGEWAVDRNIPKECIVATYRIKFGKVDDQCYSDTNENCIHAPPLKFR